MPQIFYWHDINVGTFCDYDPLGQPHRKQPDLVDGKMKKKGILNGKLIFKTLPDGFLSTGPKLPPVTVDVNWVITDVWLVNV